MKKLLCIALLASACLLSGCGKDSGGSNKGSTLTASQAQREAADIKAVDWLYEAVRDYYNNSNEYDFSKTKYKQNVETENDDTWGVSYKYYFTVYMYDKFGSYCDTQKFECTIGEWGNTLSVRHGYHVN